MKIIDNNPIKDTLFNELEVGAVFIYDTAIYIKIANCNDKYGFNAFDIEHNLLDQLGEDYPVVPRKASVTLD